MNIGHDVISDDFLNRINALFDESDTKISDDRSTLESFDFNLSRDLRELLPSLPDNAERNLRLPQKPEAGKRDKFIERLIGKLMFQYSELSEDFKRETMRRSLTINEMTMIRLSAEKRSFVGSIAVKGVNYALPPDSAIYRLTQTHWPDWHGSTYADIVVLSPSKRFYTYANHLSDAQGQSAFEPSKSLQLESIDETIKYFG